MPPSETVHGQLTVVRPLTDEDVELLVAWHLDPEVSRFWDDETPTPEEVRADLADPTVDLWIIEAGGEPVGFVQSWWEEEGPRRGGLDGFLVPHARGRGLMPDAGRALARSLLDAGWQLMRFHPESGSADTESGST